jgi:hypothetical protein
MFNERAADLFRGIRVRRSIAQWVTWFAFPAAFLQWPVFAAADIIQSEFREGAGIFNVAIASVFLIGASLIIAFLLLQRLIRRRIIGT